MVSTIGAHGIEYGLDIAMILDRAVGDATARGLDLQHRLQPVQAARAVAHNRDVDLLLARQRFDLAGDFICAAGDRCGIERDIDAQAHRSASASTRSSFLRSRRPTSLPSIIADGATEQRPRQ